MKKIFVFIAASLILWSCSKSSKESSDYVTYEDAEAEFAATLSASDTTEVLSAGNALMDSLRAGNIDYALSQLHSADTNGNVAEMSNELRERMRQDRVSDAKKANQYLKVKKDGKWYLCVKDAEMPAKDAANAINPKQIIGER